MFLKSLRSVRKWLTLIADNIASLITRSCTRSTRSLPRNLLWFRNSSCENNAPPSRRRPTICQKLFTEIERERETFNWISKSMSLSSSDRHKFKPKTSSLNAPSCLARGHTRHTCIVPTRLRFLPSSKAYIYIYIWLCEDDHWTPRNTRHCVDRFN